MQPANKLSDVIAMANHKGGSGKTTCTINIAAELGRLGYRVLIVDLDPQGNTSMHVGLNHPTEIRVSIAEVLTGEEGCEIGAVHKTTLPNVSLIYGGLALERAEEELAHHPRPNEELPRRLASLRKSFDVIIIDCPPALKLLTNNALAAATHVIVPIESGSQYPLYGTSDLLKRIGKMRLINPAIKMVGALLIRHDERINLCHASKAAAEQLLGNLIPATISSSSKVGLSAAQKTSIRAVDRSCKPAREYAEVAEYLVGYLGLSAPSLQPDDLAEKEAA